MDCFPRPAVPSDVFTVASQLRPEDLQEVAAGSGRDPEEVLKAGLGGKICMTIDSPIGPLGMFGAHGPKGGSEGAVWMLATTALPLAARSFLRQSRGCVAMMHQVYPLLYNVVDERNKVHIKWIRWCGFSFINRLPSHGIEQRPFLEFAHHV